MTPTRPQTIKAVLLDIGGTLHVDRQWIPGARLAVDRLLSAGLAVRFVTNMTQFNRREVHAFFSGSGLAVPEDHIITASRAAGAWLGALGRPRVLALCRENLREDLAPYCELVEDAAADVVLMADMGPGFSLQRMDLGLRALLNGARLVGMERNRYYRLPDGYHLDSGPFLAALEFASGKAAEAVFGKPNPRIFEAALAGAGVSAAEAVMVGDDLDCDVLAPRRHGLYTLLVETGKFRPEWRGRCEDEGVPCLATVAGLPEWLGV